MKWDKQILFENLRKIQHTSSKKKSQLQNHQKKDEKKKSVVTHKWMHSSNYGVSLCFSFSSLAFSSSSTLRLAPSENLFFMKLNWRGNWLEDPFECIFFFAPFCQSVFMFSPVRFLVARVHCSIPIHPIFRVFRFDRTRFSSLAYSFDCVSGCGEVCVCVRWWLRLTSTIANNDTGFTGSGQKHRFIQFLFL